MSEQRPAAARRTQRAAHPRRSRRSPPCSVVKHRPVAMRCPVSLCDRGVAKEWPARRPTPRPRRPRQGPPPPACPCPTPWFLGMRAWRVRRCRATTRDGAASRLASVGAGRPGPAWPRRRSVRGQRPLKRRNPRHLPRPAHAAARRTACTARPRCYMAAAGRPEALPHRQRPRPRAGSMLPVLSVACLRPPIQRQIATASARSKLSIAFCGLSTRCQGPSPVARAAATGAAASGAYATFFSCAQTKKRVAPSQKHRSPNFAAKTGFVLDPAVSPLQRESNQVQIDVQTHDCCNGSTTTMQNKRKTRRNCPSGVVTSSGAAADDDDGGDADPGGTQAGRRPDGGRRAAGWHPGWTAAEGRGRHGVDWETGPAAGGQRGRGPPHSLPRQLGRAVGGAGSVTLRTFVDVQERGN